MNDFSTELSPIIIFSLISTFDSDDPHSDFLGLQYSEYLVSYLLCLNRFLNFVVHRIKPLSLEFNQAPFAIINKSIILIKIMLEATKVTFFYSKHILLGFDC